MFIHFIYSFSLFILRCLISVVEVSRLSIALEERRKAVKHTSLMVDIP